MPQTSYAFHDLQIDFNQADPAFAFTDRPPALPGVQAPGQAVRYTANQNFNDYWIKQYDQIRDLVEADY